MRSAFLAVALLLFVGCGDDDPPPIAEQSCAELVETFAELDAVLADTGASTDEQADAARDGSALNARIDELGGCPGEPTLR